MAKALTLELCHQTGVTTIWQSKGYAAEPFNENLYLKEDHLKCVLKFIELYSTPGVTPV
jgi:hypothetical protein